jgi:hypothetical protein
MRNKVIILDLDNCISDDLWRIKHIDWSTDNMTARYHDYHSLAPFDDVANQHLWAGTACEIAVFTARPMMFMAAAEEWLHRQRIDYFALMMRPTDYHLPSDELKFDQLKQLLNSGIDRRDIMAAYDDRPEVVRMYRRNGVAGELRYIHQRDAYKNPNQIERILI